ncbi:12631_t:CDS:1 [Acaulospora colombiana]|uniref:12631_t:CDS:1 n=1 Tax=Acaulospora colombiana TaxID=27376 RepID=A0ACA9M5C9_9GLOM|nr:12631_t:CDS:1 [Acaulospora colombiana]
MERHKSNTFRSKLAAYTRELHNKYLHIILIFAIVVIFLYCINNLNNSLFTFSINSSSDITSNIPPFTSNTRRRPAQNHSASFDRIEKHCGNIKSIPVIQCLRYLDNNESDYILPHNSIKGVSSPPPICSRDYPPMLFHVFWQGPINDKLAFMMKSFLFSQPLNCSILYVWLDTSYNNLYPKYDPHMRLLHRFVPTIIRFKSWNTRKQLSSISMFSGQIDNQNSVTLSDMVRFVILYKYGGIYVDADVLLMRDMRPLYYANFEFSYRWSYTKGYNTAILRLRRHSPTSRRIIERAIKNNMTFHPHRIMEYLSTPENYTMEKIDRQLYMLPVGLFDPLWLREDGRQIDHELIPNLTKLQDFFNPALIPGELRSNNRTQSPLDVRKPEGFFPGSFAYHWHNNWAVPIHPTSWAGVLQTAYDEFLMRLRRNLYNEYI